MCEPKVIGRRELDMTCRLPQCGGEGRFEVLEPIRGSSRSNGSVQPPYLKRWLLCGRHYVQWVHRWLPTWEERFEALGIYAEWVMEVRERYRRQREEAERRAASTSAA